MNVCGKISGLVLCEQALTCLFCEWFPYLQRQNCSLGNEQTPCCLRGAGDGRDRMMPLHEVGHWAVSTYFLFQTSVLEIHQDWNVSIRWSQKSLFDSQPRQRATNFPELLRHMWKSLCACNSFRLSLVWVGKGSCTCSCWMGYPWHQLPRSSTTLLWKVLAH